MKEKKKEFWEVVYRVLQGAVGDMLPAVIARRTKSTEDEVMAAIKKLQGLTMCSKETTKKGYRALPTTDGGGDGRHLRRHVIVALLRCQPGLSRSEIVDALIDSELHDITTGVLVNGDISQLMTDGRIENRSKGRPGKYYVVRNLRVDQILSDAAATLASMTGEPAPPPEVLTLSAAPPVPPTPPAAPDPRSGPQVSSCLTQKSWLVIPAGAEFSVLQAEDFQALMRKKEIAPGDTCLCVHISDYQLAEPETRVVMRGQPIKSLFDTHC